MAYLEAMGIDSYISRSQLPAAATTRRLAIVRAAPAAAAEPLSTAPQHGAPGAASDIAAMVPGGQPARRQEAPSRPAPTPRRGPMEVPRFSLAAIVAGQWLWLENLVHGALGRDQVELVRAMAHALRVHHAGPEQSVPPPTRPDVAQFDWPIHKNQQLDLGAEAARAGVAGFVGRRVQQFQCRGVIVLGAGAADWLPGEALAVPGVTTHSTADMLSNPACKREVWQHLLTLSVTAGDVS